MKLAETILEDAKKAILESSQEGDFTVTFKGRKAEVFSGEGAEDRAITAHAKKLEAGVVPLGGIQTIDSKRFFLV